MGVYGALRRKHRGVEAVAVDRRYQFVAGRVCGECIYALGQGWRARKQETVTFFGDAIYNVVAKIMPAAKINEPASVAKRAKNFVAVENLGHVQKSIETLCYDPQAWFGFLYAIYAPDISCDRVRYIGALAVEEF